MIWSKTKLKIVIIVCLLVLDIVSQADTNASNSKTNQLTGRCKWTPDRSAVSRQFATVSDKWQIDDIRLLSASDILCYDRMNLYFPAEPHIMKFDIHVTNEFGSLGFADEVRFMATLALCYFGLLPDYQGSALTDLATSNFRARE